MKPDLEQTLQDYLDGRLSGEQRAAFEERMAADPHVAARVTAAREVGQALRGDGTELSPAFYVRARERFESSRTGPRRWFRPLSWETLGLAAAAALATVIIVPGLVRRDPLMGEQGARPPVRAVQEEQKKTDTEEEERLLDEFAPVPEPEAAPRRESVGKKGKASGETAAAKIQSVVDDRAVDVVLEEVEPAEVNPRLDPDRQERRVPAPQAPAAVQKRKQDVPADSREESVVEADSSRLRAAPRSAASPSAEGLAQFASVSIRAVGLPPGTVRPDEIRTLDAAEWDTLADGRLGPALAPLGAPGADRRLILVGNRTTAPGCGEVRLVERDSTIALVFPPVPPEEARADCAIALPVDPRPVVLLDQTEAQ